MSESKFETVSGLMDNYKQDVEKLDSVLNEQESAQRWENYHLIGDVLRDDTPESIRLDLSTQIAQAIAEEPTVLAPRRNKFIQATKAKVVQLAKPFGQVAIAASAAGLMILGVQTTNVAENEQSVPHQQVIQTYPIAGVADPVSLNYQSPNRAAQKQAYIEQQRRFQALLADHNQQVKLSAVTKEASNNGETQAQEQVEDTPK
ncbi:transcriptional regulator [Thalassotalea sp. M1531]|uniref:Anti-sigma-E factor RseA n=1 Tax=Thalassotalea algicola TaxID=2716224 RepID=A0A7Y0L985_9GAMM|nr:RseA family anti-sigma factor [Thalassotalea algicola]NMP29969.1 transcriptional regulator [Thalassotalea algicola]